jgi:hypothetical protein
MAKLLFGTMERSALPLNAFACGDVRETSILRGVAKGQLLKPPPDPRSYWPDHIGDFGPP